MTMRCYILFDPLGSLPVSFVIVFGNQDYAVFLIAGFLGIGQRIRKSEITLKEQVIRRIEFAAL